MPATKAKKDQKMFNTKEVAQRLRIHPYTVTKLIRKGELKGAPIGRGYQILEEDLQTFITNRQCTPAKTK